LFQGRGHLPLLQRSKASLTGIDALLADGKPVERILVDRGISYKADNR